MLKRILIALLVPVAALAAPKHQHKKKHSEPTKTDKRPESAPEQTPDKPETTPDATPEAAPTITPEIPPPPSNAGLAPASPIGPALVPSIGAGSGSGSAADDKGTSPTQDANAPHQQQDNAKAEADAKGHKSTKEGGIKTLFPLEIRGGVEPTFAAVLRGPPLPPLPSRYNFYVRRANFLVTGAPRPWMSFVLGIEYKQINVDEDPYPLRDAYVELKKWGQKLRFGQFKVPFGWETQTLSIYLPTLDRSLITPRLTTQLGRDIGVGLYGEVLFGGRWRWEHAAAVINGNGTNVLNVDDSLHPVGRVGIADGDTFRVGASAQTEWVRRCVSVPCDPLTEGLTEKTMRVGTDVQLDLPWFFVGFEGVYSWMRAPIVTTQYGYYVLGIVKLPLGLQVGARFEFLDVDTHVPGVEERITGLLGCDVVPGVLAMRVNLEHDLTTRMPDPFYSSVITTERVPPSTTLVVAARLWY